MGKLGIAPKPAEITDGVHLTAEFLEKGNVLGGWNVETALASDVVPIEDIGPGPTRPTDVPASRDLHRGNVSSIGAVIRAHPGRHIVAVNFRGNRTDDRGSVDGNVGLGLKIGKTG